MQRKISILFLLYLGQIGWAVEPRASIEYLISANGLCYLSFNLKKGLVDAFFQHLNDDWEPEVKAVSFVRAMGFRFSSPDQTIDLSRCPIKLSGYLNGTGIIRIEQKLDRSEVVSYIWTPMIMDHKAAIWVLHIPGAKLRKWNQEQFAPFIDPAGDELKTMVKGAWQGDDLWLTFAALQTVDLSPPAVAQVLAELTKADPQRLLQAEERWWMHWHRLGREPARIIRKKHEVFLQSKAFIKMAQSREPGQGFGQIVHSLSPLEDNAATTRDMAYSIVALSRAGYFTEARSALRFMLHADAGKYKSFQIGNQQWGVGRNYLISLSHYDGLGFERADALGDAPALYFCSQPLFLWALYEYYKFSSDDSFLQQTWPLIKQYVVEPLTHSLDKKSNLMRADCGLWDTPAPGEQFLYTSACAYQGLTSAAVLAQTLNDNETVRTCTKTASLLREAIFSRLTFSKAGLFRRSLESKTFPELLDASALETVNWQIAHADWKSARTTLAALDAYLRLPGRGYALGYNGVKKTGHESPFAGLRCVEALYRMRKKNQARTVFEWIINQAAANGEMIPSYFDRTTAVYRGSYPLIGMGAAVFILAALTD